MVVGTNYPSLMRSPIATLLYIDHVSRPVDAYVLYIFLSTIKSRRYSFPITADPTERTVSNLILNNQNPSFPIKKN